MIIIMFWNMRVMLIPIVVDVLGTSPKSLKKRQEYLKFRERIETL